MTTPSETEHPSGCLLCGAPLVYATDVQTRPCALCGASAATHAWCEAGHFVCDACHGLGANDLILATCRHATTRDPLQLARILMEMPALHMHGPEHHFLVPAVLLAATCTIRGVDAAERERMLLEARRRAEVVRGGFCGLWGACGAGVGTGIFVSVLTGAVPLSGREWSLANAMTATALGRIAAHGGPRCCKRCTTLAVQEAVAFARRELGVAMDLGEPVTCVYRDRNRECSQAACPFYP